MSAPRAEGVLGRRLAIVASVVVLATVVAAVLVTGSPSAQREARLDQRRIDDLDRLVNAIQDHVEAEGALPSSLAVLSNKPGVRLAIADPVTGEPYTFEATGPLAYRLCARFTTDTAKTTPGNYRSGTDWPHAVGRQCFKRVAELD